MVTTYPTYYCPTTLHPNDKSVANMLEQRERDIMNKPSTFPFLFMFLLSVILFCFISLHFIHVFIETKTTESLTLFQYFQKKNVYQILDK